MLRNDPFHIFILQIMLSSSMVLLLSCGQPTVGTQQNQITASPTKTQQNPSPSTEGNSNLMTPSPPTPIDAGLQNLIELIKADLANRQAVSVDEIILGEITAVEWSDSSLDCPQPGMEYLQVITPGYRAVLQVKNQSYEYHTNKDAYFVYCENRLPPILPEP